MESKFSSQREGQSRQQTPQSPPSATVRRGLVPWQGTLLAGKEGQSVGVDGRMGDRGWLGSSGQDSALRGDRGPLFGPEGREQGSRV